MLFKVTFLTAALILSFSVYAIEESCLDNPEIVEACYETRGRVKFYNGTPSFRIWKVGTNRLLGLVPSEHEIAPQNLARYLSPSNVIFGDFLVCPFTEERPGHMQYVCIEKATNLRVEDYSKDDLNPTVINVSDEPET